MDKKKLLEQRAAVVAECTAITDKAKAEARALTDDETKIVDNKLGEISKLNEQIQKLDETEERSQKIQAELGRKFAPVSQPHSIVEPPQEEKEERKAPRIPATVEQRRYLKSFHGEDANYRAYKAGRFIMASLFNHPESREWCKDQGVELRAQSSNNNFLGGIAVIPEFSQAIIDLREQYGVFRRESRVVPMASDTLIMPRRSGGLTAYFVGEGDSITESDKTWNQVQLTAKKIATLTRWSSELNDDAVISIADDLASEIAYAFSLKEDQCGFLGDGTSTYGGIFGVVPKIDDGTHTASIVTSDTGDTAFGTLDVDDFVACVGALPLYARANAKWYISNAGYANSMQRIQYETAGNTVANIGGGTGPSFLGFPVVVSQVMNSTLTTQTSTVLALFGDLRLATTFGNRSGVAIDISEDRYFESDQIAIRGKERFDIVAHDLGSTSVAGPIVALKTAGS